VNERGRTASHFAVIGGVANTRKLESGDEGTMVVTHLAENAASIIKRLSAAGGDLRAKDRDGMTPLDWARAGRATDLARVIERLELVRANHSTLGAKEIKRRDNFSATNASRIEGKLAYVTLNIQTPCPPRGAGSPAIAPSGGGSRSTQGRGWEFFTQHARIAFGNVTLPNGFPTASNG
jgi:hypothetical protein